MKGFYHQHSAELNRELKHALSKELRRSLHEKRPWRHAIIALRQVALLLVLPFWIYHYENPLIWIPSSILLGFVVFSFSVLLHEELHLTIFRKKRPKLSAIIGFFYGAVSGLSRSQFTRWHLDHHDELGDAQGDPKRHFLSPKRNKRWLKFLYFTPALFPIYFRAAARAQATYDPKLRHKIKKERFTVIGLHLAVLGTFYYMNPYFAVKAYIIPIFFVFPIAFAINRLGQHYVINPEKVANWSTLMSPNWAWNWLFLFSSYHLEHHYYPSVPFYNLGRLHRALKPYFVQQGIQSYGYLQLLKLWFRDNHKPHSGISKG